MAKIRLPQQLVWVEQGQQTTITRLGQPIGTLVSATAPKRGAISLRQQVGALISGLRE